MTDNFSEKIYKYVNTIQITIDGDSKTHDKLRIFPDGTGSFNIIYDNLKNSIKFFKNRLALRININKDSIDYFRNTKKR
ncbi:hypothetical protein GNF80_11925 [Clostridium perfringens]|nr:hypothetical protein [Clostridium perfringens]